MSGYYGPAETDEHEKNLTAIILWNVAQPIRLENCI